eukprot:3991663-Alexandrium_andersonii.AAC.1
MASGCSASAPADSSSAATASGCSPSTSPARSSRSPSRAWALHALAKVTLTCRSEVSGHFEQTFASGAVADAGLPGDGLWPLGVRLADSGFSDALRTLSSGFVPAQ